MEAQTSEIIIIDNAETNLTEITETEITETAEPSSVISVNKSKIANSSKITSKLALERPPKPRRTIHPPGKVDPKMKQNISATKQRLSTFNSKLVKGKK